MKELGILLALTLLSGCGSGDFTSYNPPSSPEATIIVHAQGAEWDVFLDGARLGRISWSQPYEVTSGTHVVSAHEVVWGGSRSPLGRVGVHNQTGPDYPIRAVHGRGRSSPAPADVGKRPTSSSRQNLGDGSERHQNQ